MPDDTPVESTPGGGAATGASQVTPADVMSVIAANVTFDSSALQDVLTDLYGDAGLTGAGTAAQYLGTTAGSDFTSLLADIDWDRWHPGDLESARYVANGALQEALDNAGIVIRGLEESAIERMATVLANGLNEGLSPQEIAKQMRDAVADPKRALVIARTETGRAQVASSMDSYRANDTAEVDWHSNAGACPACIKLDEGSPYPIDDAPEFPHHPNDRCQILPHLDL